MALIIITLTTAFVLLYIYLIKHFEYWKRRGVPYVKPSLFLGNIADILFLQKQMGPHLRDMYDQMQAPFFGMFFLQKPHIMLKDPQLIKAVLIKNFNKFCDHGVLSDKTCDPVWSNFLFAEKNPDWKIIRNKISPIFTVGKLKNMFGLVNEGCVDMVNYLEDKCKDDGIIEVTEICGRYTTDIITSCGFGINANSFTNELADFRRVSRDMFACNWRTGLPQLCYFFFPTLVKLFKMKFFPDKISNFFRNVFWATIREREKNEVVRHDFVDVVINIRKNESIRETIKFEGDKVIGQAVQFFAAGFETTGSAFALTLYELAHHPQIQEQASQEIISCMQIHNDFTYEAIHDMKYLDMVIAEVLRKHPIFPFLERLTLEDYQLPGTNVTIAKGVSVYISVYGLHNDPQYYSEPDKFDPERFNEENKNTRPSCTYLAFGEGPRNCPGAKFAMVALKAALAHILLRFELEVCKSTPTSITYSPFNFLLAPSGELPIRFKKRQQDDLN